MVREDQSVSNHYVLPSTSGENYNFSDIFWCQRLTAAVSVSSDASQKASKLTHKRHPPSPCHHKIAQLRIPFQVRLFSMYKKSETYRLDLARVNLHNPNPCSNQFPPQRICKNPHCSLCRAIDASPRIPFFPRNTSNIDNVTRSSIFPRLVDFQNFLRHIDQTRHIRRKHDIHVGLFYRRCLRHASDQTSTCKISANAC